MTVKMEREADVTEWARLIQAVALRKDRIAFGALFGHFAPRVKTFMLRSGVSDGVAEDLAQETLITVWRKAEQFDPRGGSAAAWIFTIARNLRIDALRREYRRGAGKITDIEDEFLTDETPAADAILSGTQTDARVRRALAELSEDQMRVVQMSFYQERAHAEISEMLDIPLGTVKSRLRLAMNKLRALLGDLS